MFTTISWSLWNRQNALHFGCEALPIAKVSSAACTLLHDFINSQWSDAPPVRPMVQHQWCPPEQDLVKVNFYVALFKHKNSVGIGAIVRDWRGANLGALSMPVSLSSTVAELEALACLGAVQFAADLAFNG